MKKAISVFTALTVTLWLSGIFMILPVHAAFADGDLARESDEFDVYIIKLVGDKKFKRLILNPDVFNMYGHLEWGNIQVVADGDLADYTTSELIREINDDKVYKLYPDGDVGTKKWVESLDCFTSQGFDWDSVYIINSFDRDSYTTAAEALCGGAVVVGDITLSLGPDTPGAASIPYNAEGVNFLDVKIVGSGTISQMVFKRTGVGEAEDFDNMYLYERDTRLTSGRSVSGATDKVTFISLSISAPTTISLVAELAGEAGDSTHINFFKLESASDVTSDAAVGGSFPITGNQLSITAMQGGKIEVVDNGSIGSPSVGQADAQLTQFRLTTSYEAIDVERITLYNGGTMNSTEMTNLELKVSGVVVATADAFGSDDLATFVFDTPYAIEKGQSKIFKLYGDLAGDIEDTIILYFEVASDIKGTGANYGYGVEVDISGMDETASDESHTLTLEGGEITIAFNGPIAADISDDTNDTVMLDFAMTAASNVEVRNLTVYVCWDRAAGSETMANAKGEIDDIKIVNKDTGTVLMGPTDGSSFTSVEDASLVVCNESTYEGEIYKNWTTTFDLAAGETKNLQITMDVDIDAYLDASDALTGLLRGLANLSNPIKYTGTNDYVDSGDIVPSTDITGNKMTIESASIAVALAGLPTSAVDGVKGQASVEAIGIIFTAGDASDMTLTDLVLTSYVKNESTGSYAAGNTQSGGGGLYVKNVVTNVNLYEDDGTTLIAGPKGFSGGDDDSDVTFDDLEWVISAGASKKMLVVVDITTTTTSDSSNYDYINFDVEEVGDVTALDSEGNPTNPSSVDINDSPTVYVRKSEGGTLAMAEAAAGIRPETTYVYQGQTGAHMSKFKFTTTREAFLIDKITIDFDASGDRINATKVYLEYPIDAAGTLVSPKLGQPSGAGAAVAFDLTGEEMYVPKDDSAYLSVYADMSTWTARGFGSDDDFSLDFAANTAAEFHAVGTGSSVVKDGDDFSDTTAQQMYLKRNFPTFTMDGPVGSSGGTMATRILEFTVTNNGDSDLVFNEASGQFLFEVRGSGADDGDATFILYKSNGTQVDAATVTDASTGEEGVADADGYASATFNFSDTTITLGSGESQSFYISISTGKTLWDENGDYLQLRYEDEADIYRWWDEATGGYSDGSEYSAFTAGLKELGVPLIGPEFSISGL